MITQERLKELLHFNPETGDFSWRVDKSFTTKAGQLAGSPDDKGAKGYQVIQIDGKLYLAHRLAWLYTHGSWPVDQIDHRNGIRSDNRIDNLREATSTQNQANSKARRNSLKGARPCGKKWEARIRFNGRDKHIGMFPTEQEAHLAYMAKATELWGEFARAA